MENETEILMLKEKISGLEKRLNEQINEFRTAIIETKRELSEKIETVKKENEKNIIHLASKLQELKEDVIGEFKKIQK